MGQTPGGVPCLGGTLPGGTQVGTPPPGPGRGVPCWGGYPDRTTEGVLTTRRAVCLLRSRRRTFLCKFIFVRQIDIVQIKTFIVTTL